MQEDEALRLLFEGTARETGDGFFRALVRTLAKALDTHGAWVTEYDPVARRLRALAFWMGDEFIPWEAAIDGTPCEVVVTQKRLVLFKDHVLDDYPGDPDLKDMGVRSYMGVPLKGSDDSIIGHLAVLDVRPLPDEPRLITVFELFAERAAAELRRLRAELAVREREEKLARLVDGAMDAIIELDQDLRLTHVNAAAEKVFDRPGCELVGAPFAKLLAAGERERIAGLVRELDSSVDGPSHVWIPGGLRAQSAAGAEFPAEATISRHHREGRTFHTVVLRDVNDRLVAEERIRALQEDIREREGFGGILGESQCIHSVLRDIDEVAATDASVLILGETGTGKELVARAIHARSPRRDKPLVHRQRGRHPDEPHRERALRAREGRVHGGHRAPRRPLRPRRRRHDLPGRDRRAAARPAGQAAAGPPGGRVRAAGLGEDAQGRRAGHLGDQPRPPRDGARGDVPPGPLLPTHRLPDRHAAAPRPRRRRRPPRQTLRGEVRPQDGAQVDAAVDANPRSA